MSTRITLLLAAILLNTAAGAVHAGDLIVDKAEPDGVRPRFFERVEAGKLAAAFNKRGQTVRVPDGRYTVRVPCDNSKVSNSNDVHVTVKTGTLTRVRVLDCGVEVRVKTVFRAG